MHVEKDYIYHVYNRSNEIIFSSDENYRYFIKKVRKLIYPICDIIAWCLMPNHFHFLIYATDQSADSTNEKHRPALQVLSKNFGTLLSSYTQAINKSKGRKGRLFAHNTEAKQITHEGNDYIENCFFYIHQNPLKEGLVTKHEHWEYSSFPDYAGKRHGTLCNKELAFEILNINKDSFYEQSYAVIEERFIQDFNV